MKNAALIVTCLLSSPAFASQLDVKCKGAESYLSLTGAMEQGRGGQSLVVSGTGYLASHRNDEIASPEKFTVLVHRALFAEKRVNFGSDFVHYSLTTDGAAAEESVYEYRETETGILRQGFLTEIDFMYEGSELRSVQLKLMDYRTGSESWRPFPTISCNEGIREQLEALVSN